MSAIVKDDRTMEEHGTHIQLIGGMDTFLSRAFGGPPHGCDKSYAFWACRLEDAEYVLAWVESRKDIKRVGVYMRKAPRRTGHHVHVYVVRDGHPSLERKMSEQRRTT